MVNCKLRGIIYPLRFDLHTMELLEEAYGDVQETVRNFERKKRVKDIRIMFTAMANSALNMMDKPETVTGDELRHIDLAELNEVTRAIQEELKRSTHARMAGGNEDDEEHHDIFGEEMEGQEKNGRAGEGTA